MMRSISKNFFNTPNRYTSIRLKNKNFSKTVSKIFKKIINKNIDFTKENDLKKLKIIDIKKIDNQVRNKYQKTFVNLIKPEIHSLLKIFLDNKNLNFRVGCQSKFTWKKDFNKKKYNNLNYTDYKKGLKNGLPDDLLLKPTPPHQDLSNNGFRSTSVLIFYFQITPINKDSSLLSVSNFRKKVGIFQSFKNKDNYSNVINLKDQKKIKFSVNRKLKTDSIFIFDSMTPHASSTVSKIPRLALNVKIQPKSLNYLYKLNKMKKSFTKKNSFEEKLDLLEKDISKIAKRNNSLFYELAILNFLKKDYKKMESNLKKMLLFKPTKKNINKFIACGVLRKTIEQLDDFDLKKIYNKDFEIVKNSCADSILKTIK